MINHCTECGYKIQTGFKFCPNCGYDLTSIENNSIKAENYYETTEVMICSNCGDENPSESLICSSCGISLKKEKYKTSTISTKKNVKLEIKSENKKELKSSLQKNKKQTKQPVTEEKNLDAKKIYAFIGGAIAIVFVVLLLSGTINLSADKAPIPQVNQQNLGSGINLNELPRINELKSLIEKQPNNAALLLELANLQFDSGFFEEASRNYSKYLQLEPQNADARIDMAVCYYKMGQFDKAEAEVVEALKYSPNHQTGYLNLGIINLAKQNIDKAKEWFNKTIEINPNTDVAKKAKSLLQTH